MFYPQPITPANSTPITDPEQVKISANFRKLMGLPEDAAEALKQCNHSLSHPLPKNIEASLLSRMNGSAPKPDYSSGPSTDQ